MSNLQPVQQTQVNFYAMEEVPASTLFPEVYAPGEGPKIKRRANRHPHCVTSNPDYFPDSKTLKRFLAWWFSPMKMSFGLHGETGTGKTEFFQFVADRLNEPFYLVQIDAQMSPESLGGEKDLVSTPNGVITRPTLGLAAQAYRNGGLLCLDEADKGSGPLGSALHGLVEGKPWSLPQFSMMIKRHPMCRIVLTGNTTGEGGHDRYHTSNRMDQALRSRIGWMKSHYPTPDREYKIMEKTFPMLPRSMIRDMIKLANDFRDALLGPADLSGARPGNVEDPINAVFSTRTLVNWGSGVMAFGQEAIWRESLDFAFDGSIDPECKADCLAIIKTCLDTDIDLAVKDVLAKYKGAQPAGKP